MTLEELKAEAKKHGYKLVKEYVPIKFEPCVCGKKGTAVKHIRLNPHEYYYKCNRCWFSADGARTQREAKLKWNECVSKY